MTALALSQEAWFWPIADRLDRFDWSGGLLVKFPEYRPDLFLAAAYGLRLAHYDFRAQVMLPMGWKAHRLVLEDLDCSLEEVSREGAVMVQNVEALLATKPLVERAMWLKQFLEHDWSHAVVVPLVLNGDLTPPGHPRVVTLDPDSLPEQTLLSRLQF